MFTAVAQVLAEAWKTETMDLCSVICSAQLQSASTCSQDTDDARDDEQNVDSGREGVQLSRNTLLIRFRQRGVDETGVVDCHLDRSELTPSTSSSCHFIVMM